MQRQDWATMLELALKHVQRYKESTDGYVGLALALIKLHRFDEVAQATDALEQLGEPAEAQHLRAWAAVDGGDATRGLAECDRLLEHPEYRYQAFAMRSKVQLSRGNLDKALGDANHSLATDPTSTAYALRGDIRWAQGNLEGALADYTRASAKEPDAIEPLEKRASILHALGRANEAAADISTAESLRKEHGPLWR
jgi:tetratricopeptide (TPR) repeat protein